MGRGRPDAANYFINKMWRPACRPEESRRILGRACVLQVIQKRAAANHVAQRKIELIFYSIVYSTYRKKTMKSHFNAMHTQRMRNLVVGMSQAMQGENQDKFSDEFRNEKYQALCDMHSSLAADLRIREPGNDIAPVNEIYGVLRRR
jgi:hypothetical protein